MLSSGAVTLYHTTSKDAAEKILVGGRMYRGSTGCIGGGIYFAGSVADSKRKAKASGVTLKADVYLGRTLVVSNFSTQYSFWDLQNQGYDSITLTCLNGNEYIVFNYTQVRNIRFAEATVSFVAKKCGQSKCARYGQIHYEGCGTICQNKKCKMFGKYHHPKCKDRSNKILF